MFHAFLLLSALAEDPAAVPPYGAWAIGGPTVEGALAAGPVGTALADANPAILTCYQALLAQIPRSNGRVDLTFEINPQGRARSPKSSSPDITEPWFLSCVTGALSNTRFPEAATPTQVAWSLTFSPGPEQPGPAVVGGAAGADPSALPADSPVILGSLDKSLIDAEIKRNLKQVRTCYQDELSRSPGLRGQLVEKFVIAKDGSVSSAQVKSSTLNDPALESCIGEVFMSMQFPEPKGGGIVIVSYTFVFAPG